MIPSSDYSQEIFAIHILEALKPFWDIITSIFCDYYDQETMLKGLRRFLDKMFEHVIAKEE